MAGILGTSGADRLVGTQDASIFLGRGSSDRLDFSGHDGPAEYNGQASPTWPEPVFRVSVAFTASTGPQMRCEILPDNRTLVRSVAPRPFAGPDPGLPGPTGEVEFPGRIRLRPEDLLLPGNERSDELGPTPDLPAAAEAWLSFV